MRKRQLQVAWKKVKHRRRWASPIAACLKVITSAAVSDILNNPEKFDFPDHRAFPDLADGNGHRIWILQVKRRKLKKKKKNFLDDGSYIKLEKNPNFF